MNSGISDRDSGQSAKVAGLSQNRCPVYRGMAVRIIPESVAGLLRNMQSGILFPFLIWEKLLQVGHQIQMYKNIGMVQFYG